MTLDNFRKLRGGIDSLKASEWNKLVAEVRRLSNLTVAGNLDILNTSHGRIIRGRLPAPILPDNPAQPGVVPDGTSDDAADADVWDREDQAGDEDGVELIIHSRTVYDDGGDEELHGFYRTLTFDKWGRLILISAETEYTIDNPGACP